MAVTSGQEQSEVGQEQGNMGQELGEVGEKCTRWDWKKAPVAVISFLGRAILEHLEAFLKSKSFFTH